MIDLTDKTILLTGASRGIGAATAPVLDRAGARVILHYATNRTAIESVAQDLQNDPIIVQADLSRPGAGRNLWNDSIAQVGSIDVVVNNAGIAPYTTVDDDDGTWSKTWDRTLQVNVVALADICRQAILHFEHTGSGVIINLSSRAAIRGDDPNLMHYAASKGAVVALTRSIARGYGNKGVVAFSIAPGWTATDMALDFFSANPDAAADFPLGEAVPPDEVANTIAFLASGLARHLSGSTIDINGATYVR